MLGNRLVSCEHIANEVDGVEGLTFLEIQTARKVGGPIKEVIARREDIVADDSLTAAPP